MPLPVRLQAVVDEMDTLDDDWAAYINRKTGELISFPDGVEGCLEDDGGAHADWEPGTVEDYKRVTSDKDFIALPSKYEIHEFTIMERFCLSLDSKPTRDRLLEAIRGRGAFRRFKDVVHGLGIHEDWYRYRNDALKRIATDFLDAEAISYVDDAGPAAPPAGAG
jgi:hypothetical protein